MCLDIARLTPWNSEAGPGSFNSAEIKRAGSDVFTHSFFERVPEPGHKEKEPVSGCGCYSIRTLRPLVLLMVEETNEETAHPFLADQGSSGESIAFKRRACAWRSVALAL
jgi:hypothetical protein